LSAPSCVILDCDGVLVDSEVIAARVAAECFTAAGATITAKEMIERFTGVTATKVTELVFAERGVEAPADATVRRREAIMTALEREVQPMPGIDEALANIRARKCVASSSHPDRIALTLRVAGLAHYFGDAVFSAFAVEHGKPAPDLFLLAAERMGAEPASCAVVEDSVAGVIAGKAAGMRVIGFVGGGHCLPDLGERLAAAGADTVIDDMRDLPPALEG
jgi:HAD superfamily hydrolase (TIGR01509 family)